MDFAACIQELGRGASGARNLEQATAKNLYGQMLDGRVPDLELGALLVAWRVKGETPEEMQSFLAAVYERLRPLPAPDLPGRPVVIPSYNGARRGANLTPFLALALQRLGAPVLIHGVPEDFGRVTTAEILRYLDIVPAVRRADVEVTLCAGGLAFAPLLLLAPGLARLLALRQRLGVRHSAHSLVKMFDPFAGHGLLLAAATHPAFIGLMRRVLQAQGGLALLGRATEGEPFANPKRCPRLEIIEGGNCRTLVEAERESLTALPALPEAMDAYATADWTRRALAGETPVPPPLAHQLAACLIAAGWAADQDDAMGRLQEKGLGARPGDSP